MYDNMGVTDGSGVAAGGAVVIGALSREVSTILIKNRSN